MKKFKRILIANRGEIALRIIRSAKEMDIETVSIYSEEDVDSPHRFMADYSYPLRGRSSADSYLDIDQVITAMKAAQVEAVHPGYGFLAESAEFAEACEKNGFIFIGPKAEILELMGDKISAKNFMIENEIPVLKGSKNAISSIDELKKLADDIGFPVILKAAAGGGGRGMRIVRKQEDLEAAFESASREALASFANDAVFIEKFIEEPRHIEFQVVGDGKRAIHLFERDCSIQRRHQKLFEEAPSKYLSDKQREIMGMVAVKIAELCNYSGAGTVEFIMEAPDKFYFMEMNPRIQVEHPVTEMITGIDIIKEQLSIAAGNELSLSPDEISIRGWSMEARINAENPFSNFLPDIGLARELRWPSGAFVRIDSHMRSKLQVSKEYDSMIGKVITWGRTREECRLRMIRALKETRIEGFASTLPFHLWLIQKQDFISSNFDTKFIEKNWPEKEESNRKTNDEAIVAGILVQRENASHKTSSTSTLWKNRAVVDGLCNY